MTNMTRRQLFKLGAVGAGSVVGAAALSKQVVGQAPAQVPAQGPAPQVTAESVKAAIEQLEKMTLEEMASTGIPGMAVAVVYKDAVVYSKGFGVREVGKPDLVDGDTAFQLASVSKSIGSTVIAGLVGQRKVSWDTRIVDVLPSFALYEPYVTRELTIRDMYAHLSGLPDHSGDLLEEMGYTREEVLHRLRYDKPRYAFRTHSGYTNFGMTAGGVAAAAAAGLTWEAASEQVLYGPLGMKNTSSRFDDFIARKNRARGHVVVAPAKDGAPPKWEAKYQRQPDAQSPAGGASSSLNDMVKWIRLQLANGKFEGKPVIDEAALLETRLPRIQTGFGLNGMPSFYGLGWDLGYDLHGRQRLSHSGAFALGAATNVALVPAESLGVVVLSNAAPVGVVEGLGMSFTELVLEGKVSRDWLSIYKNAFAHPESLGIEQMFDYTKPPASPTPALANEVYIGVYGQNDFYGDIEIKADRGALSLVMGPKQMTPPFPLTHYDRDVFTYVTAGESAVGVAGLFFSIGPDGKAASVRIENLDGNGQGTFVRLPAA